MVLGDHESSWCLPMLAHFAETVERYGHDHGLQAIRRDIAQDPLMEAAYRHGLAALAAGRRRAGRRTRRRRTAAAPPDPRWGATDCRIVAETTPACGTWTAPG
ncbi:hypothetical protein GCM10023238_03570 [Streptomyces heliomycini]